MNKIINGFVQKTEGNAFPVTYYAALTGVLPKEEHTDYRVTFIESDEEQNQLERSLDLGYVPSWKIEIDSEEGLHQLIAELCRSILELEEYRQHHPEDDDINDIHCAIDCLNDLKLYEEHTVFEIPLDSL